MGNQKRDIPAVRPDVLFGRIVTILEEARGSVVRAVNTGMVSAYWLIGREIVEEIQDGTKRAGYGRQVISALSIQLTARNGRGSRSKVFRTLEDSTSFILNALQFPPRRGGN